MDASIPVAGLDANLTREMLFSLRQSDGLRDVCRGTLQLLQKSVNLVIKSMTIIFEERRYWRYVLDAGPLEKVKISFLHAGPMGFVSSIRRLLFQAKLYNNESSIDLKLAILRETFNKLASILGSLYQCGRVLKEISSDIEDMAFTVIDVVDENSSTSDSSTHASNVGIVNKDLIFVTFIEKSKERLWWALKNIVEAYESLDKFSDVSLSSDDESVHDNNGAIQSNLPEMLAYATARFTRIEEEWVSMITSSFVRQPTHFQRYWFQYLLCGLALTVNSIKFIRFTVRGDLTKFIEHAKVVITEQYQERFMGPMTNLVRELTDKLKREQLVTPDELDQSKRVLHNMLLEYVDKEENSINLLDREKSLKMLNRIIGSGDTPSAPDLRSIKGLEDEIMNKVIRNYEMESFSPMKGLLFGNLMTVMLIQLQKMKLHMEAALLSMDQVLASNELTMAATAAIPGLAISCLVGYSLYWMFVKTRAPRNMSTEQLRLRLAFGDIERAINSLIFHAKKREKNKPTKSFLNESSGDELPSTHWNIHYDYDVDGGNTRTAHQDQLILRYNGLLIFQTTKFAQLLKPLFLSPRHCVIPTQRKSYFDSICNFFGFHIYSHHITWLPYSWIPLTIFRFFSNPHQENCEKCAFSHSGIGASIVSEYDGIKRDILDLANPLMSPLKKLELTGRMRIAYRCLSV